MPDIKKKITFTVKSVDENGEPVDLKLAAKLPSPDVRQRANRHRAKAYADAVKAGAMLNQELDNVLRKRDLWDDSREALYQKLRKTVIDAELALAKGGIKLGEAKRIALEARDARADIIELLSFRHDIERNTADALADQAQFEYFVASCVSHAEGRWENRPYFTADGLNPSIEKYLDQATNPDAIAAAKAVSELLYGAVTPNAEDEFLAKYKFTDDKGRLIDKNGNLVDREGRRVDESGYLIDENGDRIDAEGNKFDANGKYIVEFTEFLPDDEDGDVEDAAAIKESFQDVSAETFEEVVSKFGVADVEPDESLSDGENVEDVETA